MDRQYIGARYVPKFADPVEWQNGVPYEPLTIVTYMGASYTSKKAVPAGVKPTDSGYWAATGNYNAQVEEYRQLVLRTTEELLGKLQPLDAVPNYLRNKKILVVGDSISDENIQWDTNINKVWVTKFRETVTKMGCTVDNIAYSSRGYVITAGGYNFDTILNTVTLSNYDIIIMFGGVNDFLNEVELGNYYPGDDGTFWGALNSISSKLNSSGADVFVISPLICNNVGNSKPYLTLDMFRRALFSWASANGYMFINGSRVPLLVQHLHDGLHVKNEYTGTLCDYFAAKMCNGGEQFVNHMECAEQKNLSGTNCTYNVSAYTEGCKICYIITGTATGEFQIDLPGPSMFLGDRICTVTGNDVTKMVVANNRLNVYGAPVEGVFTIRIELYSNSLDELQYYRHS